MATAQFFKRGGGTCVQNRVQYAPTVPHLVAVDPRGVAGISTPPADLRSQERSQTARIHEPFRSSLLDSGRLR